MPTRHLQALKRAGWCARSGAANAFSIACAPTSRESRVAEWALKSGARREPNRGEQNLVDSVSLRGLGYGDGRDTIPIGPTDDDGHEIPVALLP